MPANNIVIGQHVTADKIALAKELRRDMTPTERIIWNEVRAHRLNGFSFRRQQIVAGFIVDFYCHASAVVVEIDGPIHEEQVAYDAGRDRVLRDRGLRVLRFTNDEVRTDLKRVLNTITLACGQAQPLPPAPSPKRGGGESSNK